MANIRTADLPTEVSPLSADYAIQSNSTGTATKKTLWSSIKSLFQTDWIVTGKLKSSSSTAGIGYELGSTGTVTQLVSKITSVTIDSVCGLITTHNASLAAGATVTFMVDNGSFQYNDIPILAIKSGATAGAYNIWISSSGNLFFNISIKNISVGALAEAISIKFANIKVPLGI